MRVEFSPEEHVYRVDGVVTRSATQILKLLHLGPDYDGIDPDVLERARQRGIYVDECCTLYDQGDLDLTSIDERAVSYVKAWQAFTRERAFKAYRWQPILYHPELEYCCMPDVDGTIGTDWVTVERKCTMKLDRSYALQTAAQTMPGIIYADGSPVIMPRRRMIVQLKKDGTYRVRDERKAQDYDVWRAACLVTAWKDGRP